MSKVRANAFGIACKRRDDILHQPAHQAHSRRVGQAKRETNQATQKKVSDILRNAFHRERFTGLGQKAQAVGAVAIPVPIIESRVTNAARASCDRSSVPSGRMGMTT